MRFRRPIGYINLIQCFLLLLTPNFTLTAQSFEMTMENRIALLDYDRSIGFGIEEVEVRDTANVIIRDIRFVGMPGEEMVEAYIVEPEGEGTYAGVLWGHWLGHHTSDREQYLSEAVALASKGAVSVLINAMWSEPKWYQSRILEEDYQNSIKQVIEFQRAMDLLISLENIDSSRVAFVGHDYSGMYGTIAEGANPRAKTYVFIAVTSSLFDWAFLVKQPSSKYDYIGQNAVFELTDFGGRLAGSVLCQFANNDPFISKTDGNVFFNALSSKRKEKKRYNADHFMGTADIRLDRTNWLIEELSLKR